MDSLRSPQEAAPPKKADPSFAFQSAQGRVLESRSLGMTALVERSKKSVRPILAICAKKRPGQGLQTGLKAQVAVRIREQLCQGQTDPWVFRSLPQFVHSFSGDILTFVLLSRTRVSIMCLLRSETED